MPLYLVEYDRRQNGAVSMHTYADNERSDAFAALEKLELARPPDVEIVLLSAQRREDLLATHARYFRTWRELADEVTAAVEAVG